MKYLDEVESQAEADMGSVTTASEQMDPLPSPAHSVQSFRSYRSADRSQQCYSDIKGKIVALNVDLNVSQMSGLPIGCLLMANV